jgi:Lsr2
MRAKRLTAYKKIGFTNPVIGEIPLFPGTEMAAPASAHPPKPAAVSAAEVRTWAKENGLDVSARGRLRPEIWDHYGVAHLA